MVNSSPKAARQAAPAPSGMDSYFEITKRGSTIAHEVRGGLVTFFTMAYIIVLNPLIIGTAADKDGNLISGLPFSVENLSGSIGMVAAATALIAATGTSVAMTSADGVKKVMPPLRTWLSMSVSPPS